MPVCTPYLLERSNVRSIETKKQDILPEREGNLSYDKYKPGYLVSTYQVVVNTYGHLTTGYGKDTLSYRFYGT